MATGGNPDPARILIQTDELDLVPTDANAQLEPLVAHRVRIAARIVKGHERTNEHDGFSQQKFDCSPWRRHALDALLRQKGPDQGRRLVYLFVEGEVSGIENVDLRIRHVAVVSLGFR
jgi:hypothetical protein